MNITSGGEYAMIPKTLFYELLRSFLNKPKDELKDSQQVESNADLDQIIKEIENLKELINERS